MASFDGSVAAVSVHWGGFEWTGDFTFVDLVAASTNARNGALLARRPDHYKQFTVVGIVLMALLGGLGGGITRDVLVGEVPAALTNPAYIFLASCFGLVGYELAYAKGQLFREFWGTDDTWIALACACLVGFAFRVLALFRGGEEPLAREPKGVVVHGDGRPLLGRKLAGKSQRELRDLRLLPDAPAE